MQKKQFHPEVRNQALKKLKQEDEVLEPLVSFLEPSRLKTKKAHKHKH